MSLDFYQTVGGKQFIEGTMPRIAKALEGIESSLEKIASTPVPEVGDVTLSREAAQDVEAIIDAMSELVPAAAPYMREKAKLDLEEQIKEEDLCQIIKTRIQKRRTLETYCWTRWVKTFLRWKQN